MNLLLFKLQWKKLQSYFARQIQLKNQKFPRILGFFHISPRCLGIEEVAVAEAVERKRTLQKEVKKLFDHFEELADAASTNDNKCNEKKEMNC